ncbi:MAG: SPOR domain-containing protein [Bacteroidetes Order II. Incertae sedis bacterium]|nr:SPOR domain-containing protein [Bacteroidetes Order II. bacterium]
MNDPLPRFRREEVFQSTQIPESDIQHPIPNPAQAAAAVLDALSSDAPEGVAFVPEGLPSPTGIVQDLPISGSSAAESIAEGVSGFDETLHVAAPEITTEGLIADIPQAIPELPQAEVEGINRFLYDETLGDPMDTASFSAPIAYTGEIHSVASETEWKPLENLPSAISSQAIVDDEPLLVLPSVEATPPLDNALMNLGNELPDDLRSPIMDFSESGGLAHPTEPLMILESVTAENTAEGGPISDLAVPDRTEAFETLTARETVPVLAQPIPLAPEDPIAPPTDPKQEIAMMLEQDEPAFTVAVRYLETYRQDPTGESGADALFWAAENYQKAGLPGKARGLFQDFVRQFPNHPKVSKAQEYLQWIDVDTPSEEQVTRPTLNTALATQVPSEPKQPEPPYGTPLPSFRPIGDQTPAAAAHIPAPQPVTDEPYHYIAPPVMGPTMRNPPAQPIPQTVRMSSTPEQNPNEPVSNESSRATTAAVAATATSVPLLLRAKNFVQSKPPKVRGLIYILSGLALFLIALVLFTLSRGLFSSTTGPTISQSGQTGLTNESLVQQRGTSPTPAPGTAGGLIGNGEGTTATSGGTGATASGGTTTGSASDIFRSPMEVQGGSDLNTSAGGWGWSLKFSSNRTELEKMAANLRSRGYRTGIITISSPQQGYRLILGQFKSKEEAKASKGKLPYDTPKDAWTVEIK